MVLLERFIEHVFSSGAARFARMSDMARALSLGEGA
jgi:hypothetical protein